jgi:predicted enzyme related to lactoylglutathione lyase
MTSFRHVGIVVKNIKVSSMFYKKFFGFKHEIEMSEGGQYLEYLWGQKNATIKTLKLSDSTNKISLELLEVFSVDGRSSDIKTLKIYDIGITHFALTVKNIDKLYEEMKKESIEFINKPIVTLDNKAKVAFCKDPNGCFIELVEILD